MENVVVHEDQEDVYRANAQELFQPNEPRIEENRDQIPNDEIIQQEQEYQRKTYVIMDTNILLQRLGHVDDLIRDRRFLRSHILFITTKVLKELERLQQCRHENLSRLARETLAYLDATTEEWHGIRIISQHNDDFEIANRAFPTRRLADNQIIKSALMLQERGILTKMWTQDRGMKIQCRGSGIALFNPDLCNVPNN